MPAGTVHSVCAGVALLEVQTNRDTTYRIFDWDRTGSTRPAQTPDEALRSIDYGATAAGPWPVESGEEEHEGAPVNRHATLRDGELFHAEILDLHAPEELAAAGEPTVLFGLTGKGRLETGDGESYPLSKGITWLLPADLESARVADACGNLRVLRARAKRTR